MFKLVKLIFSLVLILYLFTCVSAQTSSTEVGVTSKSLNDEQARKRKKGAFGHHLWWWGLKALSVLITVKIKIILLILFIGGGIFYGLKVWQGSALGCPEPIISEVKHHSDFHDILPYHGHSDITFDSPPSGFGGPPTGYGGYDISSVYTNTPPSYPAPGVTNTYLPPDNSYLPPGTDSTYLPPSNRRYSNKGRAMSESTATVFSDLMFRFLGVKTNACKRRFICELDFRNPFMAYALNYIGNDIFENLRLPKASPKYPKKFSDCAKLYADCEIPKEGYAVKRRRRLPLRKRNQTSIEEETTQNSIETVDLVTKYVKDQEN